MNILKPHVSINVSNVDASVPFYEKAFGVEATKRRPGYRPQDPYRRQQRVLLCLQDKVWIEDPDGNEWEVFVVNGDSVRDDDQRLLRVESSCKEQ